MSLEVTVNEKIKEAMKAKDQASLRALRAIKAAVLVEKTSGKNSDGLSEETEMKLLQKMAKQRKESIQIYKEQKRPELAETEEEELAVIEQFLPEQMDESSLKPLLEELIKELGASGPQDMGKVMGTASKKFAGKADGRMISSIVKSLLQGS